CWTARSSPWTSPPTSAPTASRSRRSPTRRPSGRRTAVPRPPSRPPRSSSTPTCTARTRPETTGGTCRSRQSPPSPPHSRPAPSTRRSRSPSATTSDPALLSPPPTTCRPRRRRATTPQTTRTPRRITMAYEITHWIGGREEAGSGSTQPIMNPATGTEVGTVHLGDGDTVARAVAVAAEAQREWRKVSLSKRTQILYRMRQLMIEHTDEIAAVITREHGKTLADARGEIARGLETLEFATSITQDLKGGFSANVSTGVDAHTLRQPLGVVAGITPFNFPAMVPFWMHPVAIATGNAFILKPSERDPSASNIVARLYQQAGLPDGVFQVVHGGKTVVDALCTHDGIAAVSF